MGTGVQERPGRGTLASYLVFPSVEKFSLGCIPDTNCDDITCEFLHNSQIENAIHENGVLLFVIVVVVVISSTLL